MFVYIMKLSANRRKLKNKTYKNNFFTLNLEFVVICFVFEHIKTSFMIAFFFLFTSIPNVPKS